MLFTLSYMRLFNIVILWLISVPIVLITDVVLQEIRHCWSFERPSEVALAHPLFLVLGHVDGEEESSVQRAHVGQVLDLLVVLEVSGLEEGDRLPPVLQTDFVSDSGQDASGSPVEDAHDSVLELRVSLDDLVSSHIDVESHSELLMMAHQVRELRALQTQSALISELELRFGQLKMVLPSKALFLDCLSKLFFVLDSDHGVELLFGGLTLKEMHQRSGLVHVQTGEQWHQSGKGFSVGHVSLVLGARIQVQPF